MQPREQGIEAAGELPGSGLPTFLTCLEGVARSLEVALSERTWREVPEQLTALHSEVQRAFDGLDQDSLSAAGRNFLRRVVRSLRDLPDLPDDERRGRIERTLEAVRSRLLRGEDPGAEHSPQPRRRPDAPARDLCTDAAVPISDLKGVGPVTRDALVAAGLCTVADLLHHLPRQYQDRTQSTPIGEVSPGDYVVVVGEVAGVRSGRGRRTRFLEVAVHDDSGSILASWFRPPPYLYKAFEKGDEVVLMGTVESKAPPLRMSHPEFESLSARDGVNRGVVVPIYSLPQGIGQKALRKLVRQAFEDFAAGVADRVPGDTRRLLGLPSRGEALHALHFPDSVDDLPALRAGSHPAHEALLWEDLFILQVALMRRRQELRQRGCSATRATGAAGSLRATLLQALPFELTGAQQRALAEIDADLGAGDAMQRLLQGDVGSGKTVVALLAAARGVEAGDQVVVLAPTEVLAFQWWQRANELYAPTGHQVALLTGGQGAAARRYNRELAASGAASVIVGTHAVFEDGVSFARLGLAVVDEQQRFGVFQRARLLRKGPEPHLLAMTATPIPRSLALTLYGDLDLTLLDERPPRGEVHTSVCGEAHRNEAYALVGEAVAAGERAFVICPRVEGPGEGRAAVDTAEELANTLLEGLPVGVLHGRMDSAAKDNAIERFRDGTIGVLVSTTVVEVGVDVPEATVMIIEDADRFGLSQLHQLRGRVGRSQRGGRCVLVTGRPQTERLAILETCDDGFRIAEEDLRLRGPGDLVGTRQAGSPAFRLSTSPRFLELLQAARSAAQDVAARPDYESAEDLGALRLAVAVRLDASGAVEAG